MFVFLLVGLLLISGTACSTLDREQRYQVVWIEDEVKGSGIFNENREPIGSTPQYIELKAKKNPRIFVSRKDTQQDQEIQLPTRYRWKDSGLRNLVFLTYAPIGWVTDLVSGAAWQIRSDSAAQTTESKIKTVAVAPPLAPSEEMSDKIAEQLVRELRNHHPSLEVLDLAQSQGIFFQSGVDHLFGVQEQNLPRLFYRLKADLIIDSKLKVSHEGRWTSGVSTIEVEQIEAGTLQRSQILPEQEFEFKSEIEKWARAGPFWTRWIPNSIALQRRDRTFNLTSGGAGTDQPAQTVATGQRESPRGWDQIFSLLDSIEITNTVSKLRRDGFVWQFAWVPSFGVSRDRFKVNPVEESILNERFRFQLTEVHLGYGPELGVQWGRHYLFLNFIPSVNWAHLRWSTERNVEGASDASSLGLSSEFGYLVFFDRNWFGRVSFGWREGRSRLWSDVFESLQIESERRTQLEMSPQFSTTNLQLGYRFF